jgi:GTP-binding protein
MQNDIRNIAIIAHVDHGKTTLVDALLKQSRTKLGKHLAEDELIMDSNELERERGITIFSKNASISWNGIKMNIIDTPGHADFGGEVERVLSLADGCLLLVDAKEGPMPQTRFVLRHAIAKGLKIIVVINKIDKPDARPDFALNKTFDLFVELGASDEILNFPVMYAAAKLGKAGITSDLAEMHDISPIFETVLREIPPPPGDETKPLQALITSVIGDTYKGRIGTGRIVNGIVRAGQEIVHISREGVMKKIRLTSLMTYVGLERVDVSEASVGDIVAVSGITNLQIGETIADPINPKALPLLLIEEPTVKVTVRVNDSPFAGREGEYVTSRQIRERLCRELESDMALRVEDGKNSDWVVSGRGELHLAILLERLRREGYEFQVSRPQVITKKIGGEVHVPFETLYLEVPEFSSGTVISEVSLRHGSLQSMTTENGVVYMEFFIPTKGLFGYRTRFLTDTKGLGIMNSSFLDFRKDEHEWVERQQGSLVAHESGTTAMYGLLNVQGRGALFVGPGVEVYEGQVVGQNARNGDIRVNVCKEKHLTNMRSKGEGTDEHFNTPRVMGLEEALEYIGDDELVEITPKSIRIRKIYLTDLEERKVRNREKILE